MVRPRVAFEEGTCDGFNNMFSFFSFGKIDETSDFAVERHEYEDADHQGATE